MNSDADEWEEAGEPAPRAGSEYAAVRRAFEELEAEIDVAVSRFRTKVREAVLTVMEVERDGGGRSTKIGAHPGRMILVNQRIHEDTKG